MKFRNFFVLGMLLFLFCNIVFAAPWDFLRPVLDTITLIEPIILVLVLFASASVFVLSVLAYNKKKSRKLFFVVISFGLFFLKLFLNFIDLDLSPGRFMNPAVMGFFDLLVLVILFYAILKN